MFKMGQEGYQIKPLLGSKNYDVWKEEITGVLSMDKCMNIVEGLELRPSKAPIEPVETPAKEEKGVIITPAYTPSRHEIERWEDKMERFEDKQTNWDDRHARSASRIILACAPGPRVHVKGMKDAVKMWKILEAQYGSSNLATRDAAYLQLRANQSDFKTIEEYAEHLKQAQSRLAELKFPIPDWMLSTSFRLGLKPELEPYIFSLIETSRKNKTELDVDEMIAALVDHDNRQHNLEESNKSLSAKFNKKEKKDKDKDKDKEDKEEKKEKKNKKNSKTCEYCKLSGHTKSGCFYLNVTGRPDWFKPMDDKKHLMKNKEETKENKEKESTPSSKAAFVPRSMRVSGEKPGRDDIWWIDSASDLHICFDRNSFDDDSYQSLVGKVVRTADSTAMPIKGTGNVTLHLDVHGESQAICLKDVHHVPDAGYNLFSVGVIESKGFEFRVRNGRTECYAPDGEICLTGTRQSPGSTHSIDLDQSKVLRTTRRFDDASWTVWHRRLAHLNIQDVKKLAKLSEGIDADKADKLELSEPKIICPSCAIGKQHRVPVRIPRRKATSKGEIVHTDLAGGGSITRTLGGARYVASFIDDYIDWTVVYFLKKKSELKEAMKDYLAWMSTQGNPVKLMRTDNGGEYDGHETLQLLKDQGIEWDPTAPHNPNQNGVAERCFRTLFERARAILHDSGMSPGQWGEAISYVTYLKNRSPNNRHDKTPFEMWHGRKSDLSNTRIFGCIAYSYNVDPHKKKLDDRSIKCRFLGLQGINKYRLWDIASKKVIISAHVLWDERASLPDEERGGSDGDYAFLQFFDLDEDEQVTPHRVYEENTTEVEEIQNLEENRNLERDLEVQTELEVEENGGDTEVGRAEDLANTPSAAPNTGQIGSNQEPVRRPVPRHEAPPTSSSRPTRSNRNQPKPDYAKLNDPWKRNNKGFALKALKVTLGDLVISSTYEEVMLSPSASEWKQASEEEVKSHTINETWNLEVSSSGKKILPGRWVYTTKLGPDGEISRYKARWVGKGFCQVKGIDYNETYAGVVKSMIWKFLLALAAKYDWEVEQIDVVTAFLEAPLHEEVWMEQPHGFVQPGGYACRLNKALYGLKQAPREWHSTLTDYITNMGYKRVDEDHSVYIHHNGIIIAIYVDDLLLIGLSISDIKLLKVELSHRFRIKDLGLINFYLGMHVIRDRPNRTIYVHQSAYSRRVIEAVGMTDCKSVKTPMEVNYQMVKDVYKGEAYKATPDEIKGHQMLVGSLLWISCMTRPDITYAVNRCSRYSTNPTPDHDIALKRIVRYLAGSKDLGLRFGPSPTDQVGDLIGYTDSSYGDCLDTRRSTSAYVYLLNNGPISWSIKRQASVATSTAEAEYMGECNAVKEAVWISNALKSIGCGVEGPVSLKADNQAAIKLADNPINHPRAKHIDIQYHKVRELISEGYINLSYIPTEDMIADGLTKPLPPASFQHFVNLLGMATATQRQRG